MARSRRDLRGFISGRLIALWFSFLGRQSAWVCWCTCGRWKTVLAYNLFRGKSKSCGACVQQPGSGIRHRKPGTCFRQLLRMYKYSAKNREIEFLLTDEEFRSLIERSCYYCGAPPSNRFVSDWVSDPEVLIYSGVDRKDSSVGYRNENCVSCCKVCNYMKDVLSIEDFIEQCKRIAGRFS
jgi:hypothetical protein